VAREKWLEVDQGEGVGGKMKDLLGFSVLEMAMSVGQAYL